MTLNEIKYFIVKMLSMVVDKVKLGSMEFEVEECFYDINKNEYKYSYIDHELEIFSES